MALSIPSLDRIAKTNPELAEALQNIQKYTNNNVTPVVGNRVAPPFTNPGQPQG